MKNKTETATLNGVFYTGEYSEDGPTNTVGQPLELNAIKAKERIGIRLTKDEEEFLAAAKARETLYGKK